jgi:hypothetical protein
MESLLFMPLQLVAAAGAVMHLAAAAVLLGVGLLQILLALSLLVALEQIVVVIHDMEI